MLGKDGERNTVELVEVFQCKAPFMVPEAGSPSLDFFSFVFVIHLSPFVSLPVLSVQRAMLDSDWC